MTSGLVGEMTFKVLPNIPPWVTVVVTVLTMLVSEDVMLITSCEVFLLNSARSGEGVV